MTSVASVHEANSVKAGVKVVIGEISWGDYKN